MSQMAAGYLYSRNLVLVDARRTVSGSATTTGVDISQFKGNGVTLISYVDTVTSSGNVTATVQHSDDNSTFASVSGATVTLTATGLAVTFVPNVAKKYLRLSFALNSGTSIAVSNFLFGSPDMATTSSGYTNSPAS